MFLIIGKTLLAASLITLVSWLSGKKTHLAGFLTALPLTSLLALAFSQAEWGDSNQSVEYAKSIFFAIPLSLLFFIPFLFATKWHFNFWTCYFLGLVLLLLGYIFHQYFFKS